ncbi:hypothetical protein N7505_002015 [Penicillium chrysogenum]|uniref:Uncharacterized protein n=1 Tax=Penicillium chrysogenum TaxID=5076 RepID=A0ABQ8WYI9_PENCH|nr:hypothetical protein N7505_002015 [Penicillium chrysogenum]
MEYLPGIEERDAINFAYGYSQKYGYIVATAILVSACTGIVDHLVIIWPCTSPSRDLSLFRNPKRCDNIGNAEPKHVNSRTEDLNSLHFCPSEAINEIEIQPSNPTACLVPGTPSMMR